MADIDLQGIAPSAPQANDADVVRRGAGPFSIALVPNVRQEVIDARGDRSSLDLRVSAISNVASPNAAGFIVGEYYDNSFHSSAAGTFALPVNRLNLVMFMPSSRLRINQLGVSVSTAGAAGTLMRCVIYSASNTDAYADELLFEGVLELDGTTTGYKSHTLDFTFDSGRQYWLGVNANQAVTIRGVPITSGVNFGLSSADATNYRKFIQRNLVSASGPQPNPFAFVTSDLSDGGIAIPSIRMRAAAL